MRLSLLRQALALAAASAVFLLCGCSVTNERDIILYDTRDDSTEDNVQLAFFGFKADAINLTAVESAIQGFMAGHRNISVSYEGIKGKEYWEAFDMRCKSDVLDDVFMIDHDHIMKMSAEGKLADLSDLPGIDGYTEDAKGQFTNADGSVYFLPTVISTYNLYINYDLLEEHGLSVPENYSQLQSCCDYFVSNGITPIVANNTFSLNTIIISKGLWGLYQGDDAAETVEKYNEDPSLLAEALVPGIELTAEMIDRGWLDTAEVLKTEQTSDDIELFLKGDRPFMITGGWASVRVAAGDPSFSYGVHPFPILDDGSVLSFQINTCIAINADSPYQEEAKEFVSYLIQPDVMWEYCDSQASYTPLKDDRLPSDETLIPSTEYLQNGRAVFSNDFRLNLQTETALNACVTTLLNGGTVSEAQEVLLNTLCE